MIVGYIDAQKSIIDSVFNFSVWGPYYENFYRMYSYWVSPRIPTETYARTVSNIADNISSLARISNDTIFGNLIFLGTHLRALNNIQKSLQE
jgi:hypothetical protein